MKESMLELADLVILMRSCLNPYPVVIGLFYVDAVVVCMLHTSLLAIVSFMLIVSSMRISPKKFFFFCFFCFFNSMNVIYTSCLCRFFF